MMRMLPIFFEHSDEEVLKAPKCVNTFPTAEHISLVNSDLATMKLKMPLVLLNKSTAVMMMFALR